MILKEVYLYPDLVEYSDNVIHPFRGQSRSICNFLERRIKPIKYNTQNYKKICVIGKSKPRDDCFVNSSGALIIEINFDQSYYKKLSNDELNPYFKDLLMSGFEKCSERHKIPLVELLEGLEAFQANDYRNEWCFKSKYFKEIGVRCSLNCSLTMKNFELTLSVSKDDTIIFEELVLKTEPDEIVFVPMLKDIIFKDNKLTIINKLNKPIYEISREKIETI